MKNNSKNRNNSRIMLAVCISFIITLGWLCLAMFSKPLYANVDNFTIAVVTNGLFGEDGYTYYLHPWLCKYLNVISKVLTSADVYTLLMHILLFNAFWILYYFIIKGKYSIKSKVCLILIILSSALAINIWSNNYTIQAAFFAMTGSIVLMKNSKEKNRWLYIIGLFFICIGFMWRIQGALLSVPFVLLDIVVHFIKEKKKLRNYIWYIVIPVCCILTLVVAQKVVNNSPKYKDGIEYSIYRTKVEDFPVESWDNISTKTDILQSEYEAAVHWTLLDTDVINTELFKKISDVASRNAFSYSIAGISGALIEMIRCIVTYRNWTLLIGGIIVCSLYFLVRKRYSWRLILESILGILGAGIILLYFTIRGRAISHVWISVMLITEMLHIEIIAREIGDDLQKENQDFMIKMGTICCIAILWIIARSNWNVPQFAVNARKNNALEFEQKCDDNALYLWGGWHKNISWTYMGIGKLPTKKFIQHNMAVGDWTYGQTYFKEYLEEIETENPAKALLIREQTYYVSEDYEELLLYLQEHYGKDIAVQKIGEIQSIPVWKFVKAWRS